MAQSSKTKNLELDESPSQVRNPKSQIGTAKPRLFRAIRVQFKISDFGLEMGFRPI